MPQYDAFGNMIPEQLQTMDPMMLASLQPTQLQMPQSAVASIPKASSVTKPSAFQGGYGKQLDDNFYSNINLRQEQLDELKQKLADAEANKPTGLQAVNLKPLAAFADSLTGNRTAQNFTDQPQAVQDYKAQVSKLRDSIEKSSNSISDDQLNYLKMKAQEEGIKNQMEKADKQQSRNAQQNEFHLMNKWDSDPITKNTKSVAEGFAKIQSGYNSKDPADYMTMIYGLMKMQDPGSTVREGEFKNGEGIGGWPERWKAMYLNAKGQGSITQAQKDSVMHQARGIYNAQLSRQSEVDSTYTDLASRLGMNPNNVVLNSIFKDRSTSNSGPKSGEVVDGYRFKGGNPSDKSSWEKM